MDRKTVEAFLKADGYGDLSNLEGVINIESAYSQPYVDIFQKVDNKKKLIRHEYTPFLWAKDIDFDEVFTSDVIEISPQIINNTFFFHDGKVYEINKNAFFIKENEFNNKHIYKILIETFEERQALFLKKKNEYGIDIKQLSFKEDIERLANGFKWLFKIDKYKASYTSNPLYLYNSNGDKRKLNGSYNDLSQFFKEAGLDIHDRNITRFDKNKYITFFNDLPFEKQMEHFLKSYTYFQKAKPGLDILNIFNISFNKNDIRDVVDIYFKDEINDYYDMVGLTITTFGINNLKEKVQVNNNGNKGITYINDPNILYLTPNEEIDSITINNVYKLFNGVKKIGKNFTKSKIFIKYINEINKIISGNYYGVSIDISYKDLFGSYYTDFINALKSILVFKETNNNSLKIDKVFEYIDIIGIEKFVKKIPKSFTISINEDYLQKLCDLKDEDHLISLYNTNVGRKYINLCKYEGWDIINEHQSLFYTISPASQFMYERGVRLFKGMTFDDFTILTFDIETRAQKGNESNKNAALSPLLGEIFSIGIKTNKGYEKVIHINNHKEEKEAIETFFTILGEIDPDIILGYNSEDFDFPFIEKRLELLGGVAMNQDGEETVVDYIRNILKKYNDDKIPYFKLYYRREATLKVGGDVEKYKQTNMYGKMIFDGIHQIKKLAAIDGRESLSLKNNVKYERINKSNRVYVKGDEIGKIDGDTRTYFFNEEDGTYFVNEIPIEIENEIYDKKNIKRDDNGIIFYKNNTKLYINSEADPDYFYSECVNILTLKKDDDITSYKDSLYHKIRDYETLVIPKQRFGLSYPKRQSVINFLSELKNDFSDIQKVYYDVDFNKYQKVSGRYIVERYLIDDLWETQELFRKTAQSSFMLAYWIPINAQKVFTMGNSSMWKILIGAWFYHNNLTIPDFDKPREINGGLIGMFESGYIRNVIKYDASSLYPSVKLAYLPPPQWDITGITDGLLHFFLDTRLEYKLLKGKYAAEGDKTKEQLYDVLQLPLKIFINSYYGFLGAWNVSPFSDMVSAHGITAISRTVARHMIYWFESKGFRAIYSHTDGINFAFSDSMLDFSYVGKGSNWLVQKDKLYEGLKGYVALYNDTFMVGRMGIDIDGIDHSCINIAKSNVVHLKIVKDQLKLGIVGGLVKKDTPIYIKEFIEENLIDLMTKDPRIFVKNYLDYINKITNCQIKGINIAKKIKFKGLDVYNNIYKTRVAAYELIKKKQLPIDIGTLFYYYNNGENDSDFSVIKEVIGKFDISSFTNNQIDNIIKRLQDKDNLKNMLVKAEEAGYFSFSKQRVNGKLIKKIFHLDDMSNCTNVLHKIEISKTKKGNTKKLVVIKESEELNITDLPLDDQQSLIKYNPTKYVEAFVSALKSLFLVFPVSVRKKLAVTVDKKTKKINIPQFDNDEIQLISGIPLEGHEDNQQNKEDLLNMDLMEKNFWLDSKMSPLWLTNQTMIDNNFYYLLEDNSYTNESTDDFMLLLNQNAMIYHQTFIPIFN